MSKSSFRRVQQHVVPSRRPLKAGSHPSELRRAIKCRWSLPGRGGTEKEQEFTLGFSKENELRVTRLAMFGWALSLAGEHMTGLGPLGQLGVETGVPLNEVEPTILTFIAANWLIALLPGEGVFRENRSATNAATTTTATGEDNASVVGGSLSAGGILASWVEYVGQSVGLTKERELAIGRCAGAGWGACLLGEAVSGKGPLQQLDLEIGTTLAEAHPFLLTVIMCLLITAIYEGTGEFVTTSSND